MIEADVVSCASVFSQFSSLKDCQMQTRISFLLLGLGLGLIAQVERTNAQPAVRDRAAGHDHHDSAADLARFETTTAELDLAAENSELSPAELFERRVLPITRSAKASSCTECHFGGVELANYIRDDQAATFAALRDAGLIDVKAPEKSKLLEFIRRRPVKEDPLVAKVRRAEYQAFRSWILAAVNDADLLKAKSTDVSIGTELPGEVIRHMRKDRVLESFVENVWSEFGRCVHCHSPEKNQKLVEKHGEQMSWIKPGDPIGTLQHCIEAGIIDGEFPDESMLVTKPTLREKHGGGPKFAVGGRTDRQFLAFLQDYANVVSARYEKTDELPAPSAEVAIMTEQHLRIVDLPASLGGKLLQADIYRSTDHGWSEQRWATADGPVAGEKQQWQSLVAVTPPRGSEAVSRLMRTRQLPPGKYVVRIYVDRNDERKTNPDYKFKTDDFLGEVEIDGEWKPGYQPPKIIHAPNAE
jgi:hypothetical protein